MGDTLAFFQPLENIPSAKDELKIRLRNGATTIAVSFKSLPDILFNPRALLDLIFDISLRIVSLLIITKRNSQFTGVR